jgi:peptidoglycan lytic transglycosylase A
VHLSRALAAASTALLLVAPAARWRRSLGPFEPGICPPLAPHGLVRGGFSLARTSRAGVRVCDAFACLKTDCGFAHPSVRAVVASVVGVILCLTANAALAEEPLKLADSQLEPVKWTELAGWSADDHLAAFAAYQTSCQALRKMRRADERGQIYGALWTVCRDAMGLRPQDADTARTFFEQNFQPVRIARLGEREGLLTGYFEPIVAGSRFPSPEFHVPVYRRPRDLVAAGYKPGSVAFPNKGVRIGRRNGNNELVPYHDRGAIEAGALDGQKLEICWIKDPLDLLSIQIEGSARVILEDGTPLRISYDSHNGYRYSSIERALIERNLVSRTEMSAQRIRDWMAAHPDEAANMRATNRSYVFFRITGLSNEGEPVGAQGVPLTPGRSIAVDRLHHYGTPFFIEANLPIASVKSVSPFGRLMIAQDTGSAIAGPARADLYWGAGDDAGRIANRIRHPGRFVMLLPRELDMTEAGRHMPLPPPKPKVLELVEANKHDNGKVVVITDKDTHRQAEARKPSARDCATGSGIDCGRKSAPPVAIMSKRLPTTGQGPAGDNQHQQHQQQQGQKQQLAQKSQPGMQSRGPDQQQGSQSRGPREKQQLQATVGEPQQRQQQAAISRGPQQKQQPKAHEGRGAKQKEHLQATAGREPQQAAMERRGPQQKQQPPTTEGRGAKQKDNLQATAGREPQQRQQQAAIERHGPQQKQQPPNTEGRGPQQKQQPKATEGRGAQQKDNLQATAGREPQQRQQQTAIERRGPQQKQQPPNTEGRGTQQKQQPKATEARGTQLKQQPPAVNINRWHGG